MASSGLEELLESTFACVQNCLIAKSIHKMLELLELSQRNCYGMHFRTDIYRGMLILNCILTILLANAAHPSYGSIV